MRHVEWLQAPSGAVGQVGAIPAGCRGLPGFDECYNQAWERARSLCDPDYNGRPDHLGYDTITQCITAIRDEIANGECVPQFCATGTRVDIEAEDAVDFPWGQYSQHTCTLQNAVNLDLRLQGYQELEVDCKLGKKTCGAARAMDDSAPTTCREFEEPLKVGEQPPVPTGCPAGTEFSGGQCVPIECPQGQEFDMATNQCVSVPPTPTSKKKGKANWGLAILGAAVVAAGAFALS